MISRIIEWSAANRYLVLALAAVALVAGWLSMKRIPLDAIPDLGDSQVIIFSRWDRSPDIIEDQVTYPIVTALLGAPRVKAVRGISDFGYSYVYVVFDEGTDLYWARSRVLEYLTGVSARLPPEVKTELGPDATGVGWVFQYALVDTSGRHGLAELRSIQDYYLRYHLQAVRGVAEVAPLGGFVRQYQINLDPNRLQGFNISVNKVVAAVRSSNSDVGGRLVEYNGREYMIRGRGYAKSVADIEKITLATTPAGVPVTVGELGTVALGPDIRRGLADLDGNGEVVSGIIVMRAEQNALTVIERVKAKLAELARGLPPGVKVIPVYDRSELIVAAVDNLKHTLLQELLVVSLVILVFLWHIPSAAIPVLTIPISIAVAFIPMHLLGMSANIMSLGGIAIAVGAMVDASIVVVEQTHKKLEEWQAGDRQRSHRQVIVDAIKEVGGPSFFALLVIAVSFLPVLALEAQEGRLFKPLAYTKGFAMIAAALCAITLDPALRLLFTRIKRFQLRPRLLAGALNAVAVGTIHAEEAHPISRALRRAYEPVLQLTLRFKWAVILGALALMVLTIPVYRRLGSEFMPALDEGALLYMPTTMPGISVGEARKLLQLQDRLLRSIPEVEQVLGKAGRADSATDPAPLSMMETVIRLKPPSQWRKLPTWYDGWPEWLRRLCRHIMPDHISTAALIAEMNETLQLPGVTNSWTMPIKGRIDMLTTGIRTPVGVKVSGSDPQRIEALARQLEALLASLPETRSVFAERISSGYFVDFELKRDQLARYGLSVEEAEAVVLNAIGGDNLTTTVEGRERYPVNVRYLRDFRGSLSQLKRATVVAANGMQVPMAQIADIQVTNGPSMLRNEDGLLTGYVYVDVAGDDIGGYVEKARALAAARIAPEPGYTLSWSGQYESIERVRSRMKIVVPFTLLLITALLYLTTRSAAKTLIILLAVPFSAVGAIWLLHLLGYNTSVAVWVGLIALLGIDAETGVFMLLYLDLAYEERRRAGRMNGRADLRAAILHGAVKRIRPKLMTVATMFVGLLPIMWSNETGADVMKRIAAPMVGGIFTSFVLELVVYPAIYELWKWHAEVGARAAAVNSP